MLTVHSEDAIAVDRGNRDRWWQSHWPGFISRFTVTATLHILRPCLYDVTLPR